MWVSMHSNNDNFSWQKESIKKKLKYQVYTLHGELFPVVTTNLIRQLQMEAVYLDVFWPQYECLERSAHVAG